MTTLKSRVVLVFLALLCSAPGWATPLVIVVPGANENVEGNSDNCFPFTCGPQRYQQIYDAASFGGVSGAVDKIAFRVNGFEGGFSNVSTNFKVTLSNSTRHSSTLSTTFADNIGADATVVFDGAMLLSGTGGGSPNPFDIVLDVANTFAYNGTDSLLLDIYWRSGALGPYIDAVNDFGTGASGMQRVWTNGDPDSPSGFIDGDNGLVTQFTFEETPTVPEPASLVLLGTGVAGLVARRCRR